MSGNLITALIAAFILIIIVDSDLFPQPMYVLSRGSDNMQIGEWELVTLCLSYKKL